MYKLLLVDDEEIICKSLEVLIDRLEVNGIEKIYTASNGFAAMELIEGIHPHIVITDIRMPDMDGLTLIKKALKQYPDIKFIVLSGHDEFQYAKEAIKLGVVDYLLKPVIAGEFKEVLVKTMALIRERDENTDILEKNSHQFRQAMLENQLNRLFNNVCLSESAENEIFNKLKPAFSFPLFCIGVVKLFSGTGTHEQVPCNNELLEIIKSEFEDYSHDQHELHTVFLQDRLNQLIMLFNHANEEQYGTVRELMGKVKGALGEKANIKAFPALSESGVGVSCLVKIYKQAIETQGYSLLDSGSEVVEYTRFKDRNENSALSDKKLNELSEYIENGRSDKISDWIDEVFDRNKFLTMSIQVLRNFYTATLAVISRAGSKPASMANEDKFRDFGYFYSINEIRIYLKDNLIKLIKQRKESEVDKTAIDVAIKFINENYHKDINMAMVANSISMSYCYFSKAFKEQTGMNFIDYLMKVRMSIATKLLDDPVNKINEVSVKVGYESPKHFTRAFKNYFGKSPKEYRVERNILKDE